MRIRWTTRIAMAVGALTLIVGVVAGGPASASAARTASAPAAAAHVTAVR